MSNRPLLAILGALALAVALGHAPSVHRAVAAPGEISTYAGGGVGDGVDALNAAVGPAGIAADSSGNLYIADTGNCRVRRLTPAGVISTIAGTGVCGLSGDGGPAASAQLDGPQSVAVTPTGQVLIADTENCRIREIALNGSISTIAGGNLCIYGGDGGPASAAYLARPEGVAAAPGGAIFISDTGNCRVRKIIAGTITTVVGTGACGFSGDGGPAINASIGRVSGVLADGNGNLYFSDTSSCRVRVVAASGTISTVAGNGACAYQGDGIPAYATAVNRPRALALDASGDLLIADTSNCRIRRVAFPSTLISTVVGDGTCGASGDGGPATESRLSLARGIATSGAVTFVGDTANCRVRRVTSGSIVTVAGTGWCHYAGDGGPATNAALSSIGEVAADGGGNLFIADTGNCRIRRVDAAGVITTVAGNGSCAFSGDGGLATAASLNNPRGVSVDPTGTLYVADSGNCRVRRVSGGVITTYAGNGSCAFGGDGGTANTASLSYPQGVFVFGSTLYIADTFNCRIRRVVGGTITTVAGNGACQFAGDGAQPQAASLTFPYGVSVDGTGIYVADTYNCRVRKIAGGVIRSVAGTGSCAFTGDGVLATTTTLQRPAGLSASGGALFIADTDNCRVRIVSGDHIITAAGSGLCGNGGDGGVATNARLDRPAGVAVAAGGSLFIADSANRRVRWLGAGADGDGDGVPDVGDNCPAVPNFQQVNSDRNFIDTGPLPTDDITRPVSDNAGDACDPDDDNDGLSDLAEAGGCNGSGALSPLLADTDGDRVLDNAECLLGSNPGSPSSAPPPVVAPDADSDGVPDAQDPNDAAADSDGDKVSDRVEFRAYNTSLSTANTDFDVCSDAKEVASVNGDNVVNVADRGLVASRFGPQTSPQYLVQLDVNKDGAINVGDVGFVALNFGPC